MWGPCHTVLWMVLEGLSCSLGSLAPRTRGNAEGAPTAMAHRHNLVLRLSFRICKMGLKMLRPALET